jgi:gluconate 2-dehydrogenase gamma chain
MGRTPRARQADRGRVTLRGAGSPDTAAARLCPATVALDTLPAMQIQRRTFLGGLVTLACAAPALTTGCDDGDAPNAGPRDGGPDVPLSDWLIPSGTTLSPGHYALLCALFDALIPPADGTPGAVAFGAAWYLDQLLGAFSVDPPRIYAGGPYSGRHGGVDGFSHFTKLTRVERIRWQTYLEGSRDAQGNDIPERSFNGPVVGIRERYTTQLEALDKASRDQNGGTSFSVLDRPTRIDMLKTFDEAFVQMAYEHAVEGSYGDPVYGGNQDMRGWAAIHYEGDRQPLGFSAEQMLHPENG